MDRRAQGDPAADQFLGFVRQLFGSELSPVDHAVAVHQAIDQAHVTHIILPDLGRIDGGALACLTHYAGVCVAIEIDILVLGQGYRKEVVGNVGAIRKEVEAVLLGVEVALGAPCGGDGEALDCIVVMVLILCIADCGSSDGS